MCHSNEVKAERKLDGGQETNAVETTRKTNASYGKTMLWIDRREER